jgi:hypothetical protein
VPRSVSTVSGIFPGINNSKGYLCVPAEIKLNFDVLEERRRILKRLEFEQPEFIGDEFDDVPDEEVDDERNVQLCVIISLSSHRLFRFDS